MTSRSRDRVYDSLLMCGVAASMVYTITDRIAAVAYPGYSSIAQAVSELFAIGAPTGPLVVSLFTLSSALVAAFALGVWSSFSGSRAMRAMALMFLGGAVDSLVLWNFFPMHMRGSDPTFTDTMHLVLSINPFMLASIALATATIKGWFRLYSMGTILLMLLLAVFAFSYASAVVVNQPTPWLGVTERAAQYGYELWQAVLAIILMGLRQSDAAINAKRCM